MPSATNGTSSIHDYSDDLEKEVVWTLEADRVPAKTTLASVGVPYFYGARDPVLEEYRAIVPPVLVIEYISDAVSLHNFQDRGDVSSVTA